MIVPAYVLRDLHVDFGGQRALDIQALALPQGRVTAVVGPNGAGKTTLLRVLAFLHMPSAGTIEYRGRPVSLRRGRLTHLRRQVTLVAQSPLLFHRSVRANVAYGLRARGGDQAERIETALAAVGLSDFADRPAWKLSGGESQRVAIARALAIDARVYLFDEPTASIDREYVPTIESLITDLGATERTVVFATHNLEQAYRLGHRVLSLLGGRITRASSSSR